MPRTVLWLLAFLAGCSTVCSRDALPFKGDASTPERTVALVQHACKNECWSLLYDLASEKTRNKYSYVEFRLGFPDLKVPGSKETVSEVIAATSPDFLVSQWHWGDRWRLAILTRGSGEGAKDFNVILVREEGEDRKVEWHVALQEQVDRRVSFD